MPDRFAVLAAHLLDAGITPSHVARYVAELREHEADLRDDLTARGWRCSDAALEARRRLGSFDALTRPVLTDPRLRSKARQKPLLYFVALPLAAQLATVALSLVGVLRLSGIPSGGAVLDDIVHALPFLWMTLPALTTWAVLGAARWRRAAWHWPVFGALVSTSAIAATNLQAFFSEVPGQSFIALTISLPHPKVIAAILSISFLPLLRRAPYS